MTDRFTFTPGLKRVTYILMGIGVLALIIGIILAASGDHYWSQKVWSHVLVNNMLFLGLGLAGLFFIAAHNLGYGGWYLTVKRIPEAMSQFIPIAGLLMLPIIIGMWTHSHHIYHWTEPGITNPSADNYDALIAGKSGFLNMPFFTLRYVLYFGIWTFFAFTLRKLSLREDEIGGLDGYKKSKVHSAIFLIFFAVTSSTMAWDFLMSIDAHWYSTMYGWYTFATLFVSGIAMMILLAIWLKSNGYLPQVTREHLHDLGKFLFAFSIFWTYLWFSQYMLIWYANIGEETAYFRARMDNYPIVFWAVLIINFIVPFFALMTARAKRQNATLAFIAIVVLIGHWLDYYQMVRGSTMMEHGGHMGILKFGFFEIGLTIGYLGLFLFVVFRQMAKASLTASNHPFYKESLHHHV